MPAIFINGSPPVQGPRGPHLFRASIDSAKDFTFQHALQLSPLFPKKMERGLDLLVQSPVETTRHRLDKLGPAVKELDEPEVRSWTAQEVASWMLSAGFEETIVDKFEEHDITGAVLLELEMQDLKELDIPSFGKRHQIWSGLGPLRADGSTSPAPTFFEDVSRPASRATNVRDRSNSRRRPKRGTCEDSATTPCSHSAKKRRNQRKKFPMNDLVLPAESASIVAIEQLLPKPHKCHKGENCPKWRKQQRMRDQLDEEFGFPISPEKGGSYFLAANLGALEQPADEVEEARPISEAMPSVVASSDLLGHGQMPVLDLQECMVRTIESRDPQENVKQFLDFQRLHTPVPVAPEFSLGTNCATTVNPVFLPQSAPCSNLQRLSRLTIPESATSDVLDTLTCSAQADTPTPRLGMFRYASMMDVSLPPLSSTPIPRDMSHSVPPNMRFFEPVKHQPGPRDPASWRRASLVLPTLPENGPIITRMGGFPETTKLSTYGDATTHAGWMRKRKTKLLRHEWPRNHYRLTGTQLVMHASARAGDKKPLDSIDVEDYFVSCSTKAGNSKLAAALKALRLSSGREGPQDEISFGFQLVPAGEKSKFSMLNKDAKTHHFAVQGRHDRADWMREVMLAKAMKQKSAGFRVNLNGEAL